MLQFIIILVIITILLLLVTASTLYKSLQALYNTQYKVTGTQCYETLIEDEYQSLLEYVDDTDRVNNDCLMARIAEAEYEIQNSRVRFSEVDDEDEDEDMEQSRDINYYPNDDNVGASYYGEHYDDYYDTCWSAAYDTNRYTDEEETFDELPF